jgi:hypothetical protein
MNAKEEAARQRLQQAAGKVPPQYRDFAKHATPALRDDCKMVIDHLGADDLAALWALISKLPIEGR